MTKIVLIDMNGANGIISFLVFFLKTINKAEITAAILKLIIKIIIISLKLNNNAIAKNSLKSPCPIESFFIKYIRLNDIIIKEKPFIDSIIEFIF